MSMDMVRCETIMQSPTSALGGMAHRGLIRIGGHDKYSRSPMRDKRGGVTSVRVVGLTDSNPNLGLREGWLTVGWLRLDRTRTQTE